MLKTESEAIDCLAEALGLPSPQPTRDYLQAFLQGFSKIVYENVSKIVRFAETSDPARSLRTPEILIAERAQFGAGGTCFSLTYLAYRMLRHFGLPANIVMGDRNYGENTHCAVVCAAEGQMFLLDMGFLIYEPVPLDGALPVFIATPINQFEVLRTSPTRFEAYTHFQGSRKYRFTIKLEPLDGKAFLPFWHRTFGFGMMGYPLVTILRDGTQYYLQGTSFQIRSAVQTEKRELAPEEIPAIVQQFFGVDPELTKRALISTLLKSR